MLYITDMRLQNKLGLVSSQVFWFLRKQCLVTAWEQHLTLEKQPVVAYVNNIKAEKKCSLIMCLGAFL
jgi:hypothetical protein